MPNPKNHHKEDNLIPTIRAALGIGMLLTLMIPPGALAQQREATCDGKVATIILPSTRNQATSAEGTRGDDVIVTGPGQETVRGLAGDDTICLRGGKDTIFGGRGDDTIIGGAGRDRLHGQRGLDRARGGAGTDACSAEREKSCEN